MTKRYETVIYDLDGTLLNTLEDLASAVNHALSTGGYPERTLDEVRQFVGNGMGRLIRLALPEGVRDDEAIFEDTLAKHKAYYALHNNVATAAYPGVCELLEALKAAGIRQAVVSNKNDPNVKALCELYFQPWISLAVGEQPGVARKPAPDSVLKVMETWQASPETVLYVGDSDVDVMTAANAGVDCASVCWGFRSEEELRAAGAKTLIHSTDELRRLVLGE